ncbi:hypothetical protein KUCAC02_015414 [Chaenocephalus aceratus]|uniref:Uncharacterized protein n=1 Tax=Chaenocephalus aceratus TaxID=36190 RepID=A0ACB9XX87_CHAAC|nr:hypothetical protein KUCAC02_015414 [Chaenocephalus aceratus]
MNALHLLLQSAKFNQSPLIVSAPLEGNTAGAVTFGETGITTGTLFLQLK